MKRYLNKRSFGTKLILIFLIVLIVPLVGNSLLSYFYASRTLERETYDYLSSLASVTMSKVENSVQTIENTAFFIAGNERIQEILGAENEDADRLTRYTQYKEVKDKLSDYVLLSGELSSAYIKDLNGYIYSCTKRNQASPESEFQEADGQWICRNGHIYLKRGLYRYADQKYLGSMVLEADSTVFYNIVKDLYQSEERQVYIVDEEDTIIACPENDLIGEPLPEAYRTAVREEGQLSEFRLEGIDYRLYVGNTIHNGWRLVLALPEDYYKQDVKTLQSFMLIIGIFMVMAAAILVIFAGKSVTRPIIRLSAAMEEVGQGNFEVSCPVETEDEIGVLSSTFNDMVQDMQRLIDNVYHQEMMKQEVEMKSLQMQINPHFLYNTLDTINWIARLRGVNEVGSMTAALGNLMRYSLSKNDFVTIEEELKNLNNYIEIQNVRYGDRMTIEFQVEEEMLGCYIPKLLIQPILENAIVHGVEDKIEPGLIQIRVFHEEEELYLVVEDDGVGMTQEAIESLLSMDYDTHRVGHVSIGVYNVNRRIQAVFGKNCGLQIQSQLGAGTKITLHVKILHEIPDIRLKYN